MSIDSATYSTWTIVVDTRNELFFSNKLTFCKRENKETNFTKSKVKILVNKDETTYQSKQNKVHSI